MQIQDQPHIGVLGADPAAITQFLRRVQALGGEHAVLLPLSPAAVPDCEPYLCGASTQPPLPKLRAAAEVLAASGCTVIAAPDSAGVFCEEITAASPRATRRRPTAWSCWRRPRCCTLRRQPTPAAHKMHKIGKDGAPRTGRAAL